MARARRGDFTAILERQREWSERTFGPAPRVKGICAHIRKELAEIEASPRDLKEWVDVAILAFDGAWRSGATPQQFLDAYTAKLAENEAREWPDWRTRSEDEAIEHCREELGQALGVSGLSAAEVNPEIAAQLAALPPGVMRLDYSCEPPGYTLGVGEGLLLGYVDQCGDEVRGFATARDALAAAWIDYKEQHDPPGMRTDPAVCEGGEWQLVIDGVVAWYGQGGRAAAWAWHDKRLALADHMDVDGGTNFWPMCLTWTDKEVAEVERWNVDSTAEMPAVLRVVGLSAVR